MKYSSSTEKAIIFDMDGVLIDSMDTHFAVWADLLKPYAELSREEFESWSGRSTEDIFDLVKAKYGVPGEREDFKKKKNDMYLELADKVKIFSGVKEVLTQLREKGFKLAVATSEPSKIAHRILENLQIKEYFQVIVGSEMVKHAKPEPDLFLHTAEMLGVRPQEALVVEDSPTGIEASKAAGMTAIGITTTHSQESLARADVIINHIEELPSHL